MGLRRSANSACKVEDACIAWLPEDVQSQLPQEVEAFGTMSRRIEREWEEAKALPLVSSESNSSTRKFERFLKWPSLVATCAASKTPYNREDIERIARVGHEIVVAPDNCNLFVQIRWASCLEKLLKARSREHLRLQFEWEPLMKLFRQVQYEVISGYTGATLVTQHALSLGTYIRVARRYFAPSAVTRLWETVRVDLDDLSSNIAVESVHVFGVLVPVFDTDDDQNHWASLFDAWFSKWMQLVHCNVWDSIWLAVFARVAKHKSASIAWDGYLPHIFNFVLESLHLPIGGTASYSPHARAVPALLAGANAHHNQLQKNVAKLLVYLLDSRLASGHHLKRLIDLIAPFYHPSNGGSWTAGLERFLRYLYIFFNKRLCRVRLGLDEGIGWSGDDLSQVELLSQQLLRLTDLAIYSKNSQLSITASKCMSFMADVNPAKALPKVLDRLSESLETATATHQLNASIRTLATCVRSILQASDEILDSTQVPCRESLAAAMFTTLPGIDVNDRAKSHLTFQFYASVFSSIGPVDESSPLGVAWSEWLEELLSRLFGIFRQLDNSPSGEASSRSQRSSFIVAPGSLYRPMIECIIARLSDSLFGQVLRKVSRFALENDVTGITHEIGLLLAACVYRSPSTTMQTVGDPLIESVASKFASAPQRTASPKRPEQMSPAMESSIVSQLELLVLLFPFCPSGSVSYKSKIFDVINLASGSTSSRIYEQAGKLLNGLLSGLLARYPLDEFRLLGPSQDQTCVEWRALIEEEGVHSRTRPLWHAPTGEELDFANAAIDSYLLANLDKLEQWCGGESAAAVEKDDLRSALTMVEGCLRGMKSALPDFQSHDSNPDTCIIVGTAFTAIARPQLRQRVAHVLHLVIKYLLAERADDTTTLILTLRVIDMVVNPGLAEFDLWMSNSLEWQGDAEALSSSFVAIGKSGRKSQNRPGWLLTEAAYMNLIWRSSQVAYRRFQQAVPPQVVEQLVLDLLEAGSHEYKEVRDWAVPPLERALRRFPRLVHKVAYSAMNMLRTKDSKEGAILGACNMLALRPVARYVTCCSKPLTELVAAIAKSSCHDTVRSQNAISQLFTLMAYRFPYSHHRLPANSSGPLVLEYTDDEVQGVHDMNMEDSDWEVIENEASREEMEWSDPVLDSAYRLVDRDNMHWRYMMMMASVLFMRQRLVDGGKLMEFYGKSLLSELGSLRELSALALTQLLWQKPLFNASPSANNAARTAVQEKALSVFSEEACHALLKLLVHGIQDEKQKDGRSSGMNSFGAGSSQLLKTMQLYAMDREQPYTKFSPSASVKSSHLPIFSLLFTEGAAACGSGFLRAFKEPLRDLMGSMSEGDERAKQFVAVIVVSGLCKAVCDRSVGKGDWDEWLRDQLKEILVQAPNEAYSEWCQGLRYIVSGGRGQPVDPTVQKEVLQLLMELELKASASAESSALAKYLIFLGAVLCELNGYTHAEAKLSLLGRMQRYMAHPSQQVRNEVAYVLNLLLDGVPRDLSSTYSMSSPEDIAQQLSGMDVDAKQSQSGLLQETERTLASIPVEASKCTEIVLRNNSAEPTDETRKPMAYLETAFLVVKSVIKQGGGPALSNFLLAMLPSVLKVQEHPDQDFAHVARTTLVHMKYITFKMSELQQVINILAETSKSTVWYVRAATLVYLQAVYVRHPFTLTGPQIEHLQNITVSLLSDNQVEVRDAAAVTLAGFLQGASDEVSKTLRTKFVSSVHTKQAERRRLKRQKLDVEGAMGLDAHASLLGLCACIRAHPYDVPSWLPEALMVLADCESWGGVYRDTVKKLFGEFRRTHTDTWATTRSQFTEEQLERLGDLRSSPSYFA